jgi:RNA polymerase sigma-70 factor (ECF subfamily)
MVLEQQPETPALEGYRDYLLLLARCLAALPDDQRVAVEMHHLRDLPVSAIAAELGKTEASVAGLLRRGLKRLRELLGTST